MPQGGPHQTQAKPPKAHRHNFWELLTIVLPKFQEITRILDGGDTDIDFDFD